MQVLQGDTTVDVKARRGLFRLNWKSVLLWLPLALIVILLAIAAVGGPVDWLVFLALLLEAYFGGFQVHAVRKWRSDRARARLAAETDHSGTVGTDDIEALKDAGRVREIRRRVRRRLIRRAFGVLLAAPLFALGALGLAILNVQELAGEPGPVLVVSTMAIALASLIALISLCWRRWSDLFGDPIVLRGQAVAAAGSTQAAAPEEADPELLGTEMISEMNSPTLLVEVNAGWRLTRDRGATPATQPLGQRKIELVSGAVRAVPRSGTVLLMCSSRGRCIGRLGQFEGGERAPGRRR
jgi:hypothetical protein